MSETLADDLDFGRAGPSARVGEPSSEGPSDPGPRQEGRSGPTLATVAGERVISPVAGGLGLGRGGKLLALLGLVAGCGVFLAATWSHTKGQKARVAPEEPVKQVVDYAAVRASPAKAPAPVEAQGAAPPVPVVLASEGAPTAADGQIVPALSADGSALGGASPGGGAAAVKASADAKLHSEAAQRAARLQTIRSAPLLAYSAGAASPASFAASGPGRAADQGPTGGGSELDQLRRGSTIGLVRATRLPDRNFLLSAGAVLPCVLETALDTSAPGFVTCRVPRDVYSDSGGVVLMEKGSRVIGEYRSGFQQGRARIFVLWDRITTPGGVAVDVSSSAADALGRAGFDGRIDSHFWQRFGGALLLTTVQGALSAAATADARFASIGQAPSEAASVALRNSVDIPPTLTKPQGSEVAIFVSRDLDFSTVYALKGH